ncbi:LytR C-terminal domain-containing protein [Actinomycetaceae bacterium TAE3-ERU4]|nr:LytR C-terminal domain-containing protein [Actinomycetaceae bacterium TAE3-ERU4]
MSNELRTPREIYRERLEATRTTTYLVTFGILAVVLIIGLLIASGVVRAPFDPAYKHKPIKPTYYTTPCLPADQSKLLAPSLIETNVYNATAQAGLAASAGESLKILGAKVKKLGNSQAVFDYPAQIQTSIHSIPQAYSLAALVPGAKIVIVPTRPKQINTLTLILGETFERVITPDEYKEQATNNPNLTSADKCLEVDPLFIQKEEKEFATTPDAPSQDKK